MRGPDGAAPFVVLERGPIDQRGPTKESATLQSDAARIRWPASDLVLLLPLRASA